MKYRFSIIRFLVIMLLQPVYTFPSIILPDENNSLLLADELSSELLKNPSGKYAPFYIKKLIELSPAAGRKKVSLVFRNALDKAVKENDSAKITGQILKLGIDELEGNFNESSKSFTAVKRWNISGPWKNSGRADIDTDFVPERAMKYEDIAKSRYQTTDNDGILLPFKADHGADETAYATASVAGAAGLVLWLESDAVYKLIINGDEVSHNSKGGIRIIEAYRLTGAEGYTIQIKMQSGGSKDHPHVRVLLTDEKHDSVQLENTNVLYNQNFKYSRLFRSDESGEAVPREASVLTGELKKILQSGNCYAVYPAS